MALTHNHALDLLAAEEDWLHLNKKAIQQHLEESFAQAERGETYTPEEARKMLATHRSTL
jgi:hypothetical protein